MSDVNPLNKISSSSGLPKPGKIEPKGHTPSLSIDEKLELLSINSSAMLIALQEKNEGDLGEQFSIIEEIDNLENSLDALDEIALTPPQQIELTRLRTVKTALKIMLMAPEKQLEIALQGIKSPPGKKAKPGEEIPIHHRQFAKGAAKSLREAYIIVPLSQTHHVEVVITKDTALILPTSGIGRKGEIEEELEKAEKVENDLNQPDVIRTINKLKLQQLCKAADCKETVPVLSRYQSVKEFLEAMNMPNFTSPEEPESIILLTFCRDPQNKLILEVLRDESPHITIGLKKTGESGAFDPKHPIITTRGEGDLESIIQKPLSIQQRAKLCYEMLDGMYKLHMTGKTKTTVGNGHGDLKTQNILVYTKKIDGVPYYYAEVTDLGKLEPIPKQGEEEGYLAYWGNARLRPSEMVFTQKGDVQGIGFLFIRTLEEACGTDGKPLLYPSKGLKSTNPNSRRCFECFLISNPVCTQRDLKNAFDYIADYTNRAAAMKASQPNIAQSDEATEEFTRYIKTLIRELREIENENDKPDEERLNAIDELETLLIKMTNADPKNRITAQQAMKEFPMALMRLPREPISPTSSSKSLEEPTTGERGSQHSEYSFSPEQEDH